jgi:hypothetical protein
MTDSRKLIRVLCKFLACVVLGFSALYLSNDASGSPSTCCDLCVQRFNNCDAHFQICCRFYNGCIQQCGGACAPMNCDNE